MSSSNQTALLSQQKSLLPNPFELLDSDILEKVYLTHTYDDEVCDKHTLYNLVLSVISHSHRVFDTYILKRESSPVFLAENRNLIFNFKPEYNSLKLISCQMTTVPSGLDYAHQTTMRILSNQLRTFSWDAKVIIALAAFSLDYGNFWNIYAPTTDPLGNTLKQLNQVQHRTANNLNEIYDLVELVKEVVEKLNQWGIWSAEGHDTEDVPALSDALQEIPLVVYWAVASLVACTSNFNGVYKYNLSQFKTKLSPPLDRLKVHLDHCKLQIDDTGDYRIRKNAIKKPKDIVDFLKLLIHRNGSQNAPLVYDGSTRNKVGIEVFKQKHVLLFISGLYSVGDEIRLLNYIHEKLLEDPKEFNGYNKDDFKILWIPIVDNWDNNKKHVFRHHLDYGGIKWYVVEHFAPLPGIRLIREDLKYADKPILPVVDPLGKVINDDALHIIFEWGIEAFPFGKEDGSRLNQKWKWFWDEIRRANLDVQVKGDRYIFLYGGNDNKWIQEFKLAVDKIKRDEDTIKREDVIIDAYQLGKDDPKKISRFWMGIESKRQAKQFEKLDDEIQQVVKSLLCLKRDTQGWALLSKGSHLKVLGHGGPMYQTVAHFDEWKKNVLEREGFDIAFKEYYDRVVKDLPAAPQPCAYMNIDNYPSNVIATITCPNASCGRVMEVTSVSYKCCHRDAADGAKA